MRALRTILAFGLWASSCPAADWQWQTDPRATTVNWTLGDILHTVHGTFQLKRGAITFDPDSGKATGELVVDAASGESGSGARDGRMKKKILEVEKYPEIVFVPDRVEGKINLQGESAVQIHGLFTIHGTAHELTIPARVNADGHRLQARLSFAVPYVKWGMKNPSTLFLRVSDSVAIDIQAAGAMSPRQ